VYIAIVCTRDNIEHYPQSSAGLIASLDQNKGIAQSRGNVDQALVEALFAADWIKENLVDSKI